MPAKRNHPQAYDAKLNKPAPKKQGILKVGALAIPEGNPSGPMRRPIRLFQLD